VDPGAEQSEASTPIPATVTAALDERHARTGAQLEVFRDRRWVRGGASVDAEPLLSRRLTGQVISEMVELPAQGGDIVAAIVGAGPAGVELGRASVTRPVLEDQPPGVVPDPPPAEPLVVALRPVVVSGHRDIGDDAVGALVRGATYRIEVEWDAPTVGPFAPIILSAGERTLRLALEQVDADRCLALSEPFEVW
jgi:hypothetical protein